MKNILYGMVASCALFALAPSARAAMTTVENFESYPSSAALQATWIAAVGAPVVTLENNVVCEGTNAMSFTYSGTNAPFTNLVQLTFGSNQNWTSNTVFTFNYGGTGCSNDTIVVQFLDQFGAVLGTYQIPGGTLNPPCSMATVDISNGNAFTNVANGTGLQSVRAIQLGVVAGASGDTGTVYFDNLQVGNRGLLSVLGSSVALGYWATGASNNTYINGSFVDSYAANLTTEEATNGWRVVNQSVPGDTTASVISRFYTDEVPVGADEDQISLSLGNEGLPGAANPQAIYNQFFTGITNLIAMSRSNNIIPMIGNGYPRDAYTSDEYVYLKKMDLQLNTLDVPSVNFLGATDDGSGHWVSNSFINLGHGDGIHPNNQGHYEMFLTIVPSVFDALKNGKPTPQWGGKTQCLRIFGDMGQPAPLSFTPSLIMHSFSLSFRVRSTATGTVASVTLPSSSVHPTVEITATGFAYMGTNGVMNNSGISGTDGAWHDIVIAHEYARGLTWFYVDGVLAATVPEHLTPVGFVLGGHGSAVTRPGSPVQADYENWFVHRSMMNAEEVNAQYQGHLQQASLDLFAPLDDNTFVQGAAVTNRAQSYSVGVINGPSANYQSVPTLPPPTGLVVSSNSTPAIILNWTDPVSAAEDAYYVDRSTAGGPWTNITILSAHATNYTDMAVGIGTNYQYRVSYSSSGLRSDYALSAGVQLPGTNSNSTSVELVDFGPNDGVNGNLTPSPDVNGNYWNNLVSPNSVANGLSLANLVTTNNVPTTIGIAVTSASWLDNGIQNGGLTNPAASLLGIFAIPTATEDYFFVQGSQGTAGTLQISGLNPLLTYNLSMFGTRNTTSVRTSTYSVTDINGTHSTNLVTSGTAANSGTNPSDTAGNDKTIVSLNGLVPNASGNLTLTLTVADSGGYAYLGALEIASTASPLFFSVQPRSQTDRLGTTNTLTAIATSSQPVNYQWYFANAPLPGATGTNLVLADVDYTNAGNYYVVASNSVGSVTSAVAVVSIVPVHVPAQAILIDFGPDGVANTDGATTASPDVNGNYWNNMDSSGSVPNGLSVMNMVTANNTATTVGVTITSSTWLNNGITHGGLTSPDPALLADFAIPTVTEDYFFIQTSGTTGTLQINGLDPGLTYNLSMFGTRTTSATDTRNSIYSVTDVNGLHTVTLQTSGPGAGTAANPYGNNSMTATLGNLVPDASGDINLTLAIGANSGQNYAYLGALEITPNLAVSNLLPPGKIAGGWHLQFTATPGLNYHVERAPNVNGPWIDLGTVICPASSLCAFDDTNALSGQAFYRLAFPN